MEIFGTKRRCHVCVCAAGARRGALKDPTRFANAAEQGGFNGAASAGGHKLENLLKEISFHIFQNNVLNKGIIFCFSLIF